ncbi:MAG: hypothetical protein ACOYIH_02250 [Candidatus Fimadaptatus sp.]|jgi:hypothetical protein
MRYSEGMAIGAASILAAMYSAWQGGELAKCLTIAVCAGMAIDAAVRFVLSRGRRRKDARR